MALNTKLRISQYPTAILRFLWLTASVHYSIIPYIILIAVLQPLHWILPKVYYKIEGLLFNTIQAIAASWIAACGHRSKLALVFLTMFQ